MASPVNLAEVLFFNQNIALIKVKIYAAPPKLKDRRFFIIMMYILIKIANVAQLVEHLVEAQSVGGAIPSVCTMKM